MLFLFDKKNQSFLMSPTVGDLFKSPTENGANNHPYDKSYYIIMVSFTVGEVKRSPTVGDCVKDNFFSF